MQSVARPSFGVKKPLRRWSDPCFNRSTMSNAITEKYFVHTGFAGSGGEALAAIRLKTHFRPVAEIFRGQIYEKNKIGSLLYRGVWKERKAVLKIQGLKPEVDELTIIRKFNRQNTSTTIRLPELYDGQIWNAGDGYGYLLLEYIDAAKIYQPPFATSAQRKEFCSFYQEYKTRCVHKPLFTRAPNERSSLVFTTQRLAHWIKIAQTQGHLAQEDVQRAERFLILAAKHLPSIRMEFMHGHLTCDDIFQLTDDTYVVMSNLFWSYRPEYYDTTFHLWAGIKSVRNTRVSVGFVLRYLNGWLRTYRRLPVIARDHDFQRKFSLMMAERCLGALLLDIRNQHYTTDRTGHTAHLRTIFGALFQYFVKKLENGSKKHSIIREY